jgi:hypothetical protein
MSVALRGGFYIAPHSASRRNRHIGHRVGVNNQHDNFQLHLLAAKFG